MLRCDICGVVSTSATSHEQHLRSRRHRLQLKACDGEKVLLTKAEYRENALQQAPDEEELAKAAGIDLEELRKVATLRYEPCRYGLREAAMACLGLESQGSLEGDEAVLKTLSPDPTIGKTARGGLRGPSTRWIRRWKQRSDVSNAAFTVAYLKLLREVVMPHIADPRGICYQRCPTFRCHVPGGGPPNGRPHVDAEYCHSRAEINFWTPLTPVWDSNSLFTESGAVAPNLDSPSPVVAGLRAVRDCSSPTSYVDRMPARLPKR